jgi:fatty acid-binding protein DegV
MMRIKISADSTCDLPARQIAQYDIGIIPLYIIEEGRALKDGVEIKTQDVFAYTEKTGRLCSTSAVNIGDYINCLDGVEKRV